MESEAVEMSVDDSIAYIACDPTPGGGNLGCAEFTFCPVWKRGRMVELFVYPRQQRTSILCYHLDLLDSGKINTFSFDSWLEFEDPRPWRMSWCKEHKTVCYEVYVPKGTSSLSFNLHFGNSIDIHFGNGNH